MSHLRITKRTDLQITVIILWSCKQLSLHQFYLIVPNPQPKQFLTLKLRIRIQKVDKGEQANHVQN